MPDITNASASTVETTSQRYSLEADSRHQTLAYLSRYLFWAVLVVLLAVFGFLI